jgi:hypothetical protein
MHAGKGGYSGYYGAKNSNTRSARAMGLSRFGSMGALDTDYEGFAVVTTSDPAPAGDLKIHSGPSSTSPQVGGADKGELVGVLPPPDGSTPPDGWVYLRWSGTRNTDGSAARNAAAEGYAASAYLVPVTAAAPVSPVLPTPTLPIGPSPNPNPKPAPSPAAAGMSTAVKVAIAAALAAVGYGVYRYAR